MEKQEVLSVEFRGNMAKYGGNENRKTNNKMKAKMNRLCKIAKSRTRL